MKQLSITILLLMPLMAAMEMSRCRDMDMSCAVWIATNRSTCDEPGLVMKNCPRMCQICGEEIDYKYDVRRLHPKLTPVAWMIGRWRSEFGGKAFFPTIPKFTYGEQIDISLSDVTRNGTPSLNYTNLRTSKTNANDLSCATLKFIGLEYLTWEEHHSVYCYLFKFTIIEIVDIMMESRAFAWDLSVPEDELIEIHSESGYITCSEDKKSGKTIISLTTAMSNGEFHIRILSFLLKMSVCRVVEHRYHVSYISTRKENAKKV
ncbi:shTK domain protein [Dictyocaulus viviparus]|uniref:ShTK domain protein n=1 Tax=Dictyocaulus viviparus TaxID=29172 RepID=A0A0D8Y2L2_DICVI|nr:shTK domain protein [Dictyocaulus viviparus]